MNVFYLDRDPIECAMAHCDTHVVKMVTEYTQLLSMAMWTHDPEQAAVLHRQGRIMNPPESVTGRRSSHYSHPCALWVQSSREHFDWLKMLACCLAAEYFYRYGSRHKVPRQHASFERYLIFLYSNDLFPSRGFHAPPQAMPDRYRGRNTVQAYRRLYRLDKIGIAYYTRRPMPEWIVDDWLAYHDPVVRLVSAQKGHAPFVSHYKLIESV